MTLILKLADQTQSQEWDNVVMSSSHGTIFHTWKWLKCVEKHTRCNFLPIFAFNESQLVAIYPVFLQKKSVFNLALSPPAKSYLLYLGPVIADYDSMKQNKRENLQMSLQERVNEYLFSTFGCKYIRICTSPGLIDSRFFTWNGFLVHPQYTYRINLSRGIDEIWGSFDRKLRVDINRATKEQVIIKQGDLNDLLSISASLSKRFVEQGYVPNDYRTYLTDLYQEFYPEHMKIFIAVYNGERVGGMISLCFKRIMYLWIGIPKSTLKGISPNDLVQWEAIKWAHENHFEFYEEMDGGDNLRLQNFKSKYNPDLHIWYTAISYNSLVYKWLENVYRSTQKMRNKWK